MDVLVVDLTHGGVIIALELEKLIQFDNIYAYDIYNTLTKDEIHRLYSHNIKIWDNEKDVSDYLTDSENKSNELLIVNPIHSYFNIFDIINIDITNNINKNINKNNIGSNTNNNFISSKDSISVSSISINNISITEITHHQAVKLILEKWKKNITYKKTSVIEVTGVKGKTSVVSILKEILINKDPLVLSSLGAKLYKKKGNNEIILKKNISITPASILKTIKLAKKIANPDCRKFDELIESIGLYESTMHNKLDQLDKYESTQDLGYDVCIFENSLGVTGLGDVGVLTNIVENYPIAKNNSNAKNAKEQVFNCDIVIIEKETLDKYYLEYDNKDNKINTFSFDDRNSNLFIDKIEFGLNITNIKIKYNNIKTSSGRLIDGYLNIETFAPGKHQVLNVLASVAAALAADVDVNLIKNGLATFKGISGRTSLKTKEKSVIIEEINPGINTKAIESSINMINHLKDFVVIIGGKYGVTCEEIDENKVATYLDGIFDTLASPDSLILTDDLGKEIGKKMKNNVNFVEDPFEAQDLAILNKKNILFIYRSNYSQIDKR